MQQRRIDPLLKSLQFKSVIPVLHEEDKEADTYSPQQTKFLAAAKTADWSDPLLAKRLETAAQYANDWAIKYIFEKHLSHSKKQLQFFRAFVTQIQNKEQLEILSRFCQYTKLDKAQRLELMAAIIKHFTHASNQLEFFHVAAIIKQLLQIKNTDFVAGDDVQHTTIIQRFIVLANDTNLFSLAVERTKTPDLHKQLIDHVVKNPVSHQRDMLLTMLRTHTVDAAFFTTTEMSSFLMQGKNMSDLLKEALRQTQRHQDQSTFIKRLASIIGIKQPTQTTTNAFLLKKLPPTGAKVKFDADSSLEVEKPASVSEEETTTISNGSVLVHEKDDFKKRLGTRAR